MKRRDLLALTSASMAAAAWPARAASPSGTPIRIGEVNSYKAQPAFLEPYRRGMELALDEVNDTGGVLGRPMQLVVRDDNGTPGDAVRAAEELLTREKVDALAGAFLSNVGLALADFAQQRKAFYLASEPLTDKLVWAQGNRYTFRLRASTTMQTAMLIPDALRLKARRWALVYPNYEYGQSAVASFKAMMAAAQKDIEFVAEQATPLGKLDAGPVVQALADAKPDAIFNVLFAADLAKFVREGHTRGLFPRVPVASLLTGEPEYLEPLREETPEGWIVTGYPWYGIQTPEHKAFFLAYRRRWNDNPKLGSVVGYSTIRSLAAGFAKAGGTDTEKLVTAFRGLAVSTPFGRITYRPQDHQSTMGAFVGRTKRNGSQGTMVDYVYVDGATVQPPDAEVARLRPASAR